MNRRPLPSAGELTSFGAVNPLATLESCSAIRPFPISGTGGVGVGVGSARRLASGERSRADSMTRSTGLRCHDDRTTPFPPGAVMCDFPEENAVAIDLMFGCM